MRLPPTLVLFVLSIPCVCAPATAEAGVSMFNQQHDMDVIAPLLERGRGDPSVSSPALNLRHGRVGLSQSPRQNWKISGPSFKEKSMFHGQHAGSGTSGQRSFVPQSHCNPHARIILAWHSINDDNSMLYGGETAYEVPYNIYHADVVIKEILINSDADEIVARQQIAIMDKVMQLVGWGVIHRGNQQIWLVVQKLQGIPADLASKEIKQLARNIYATHLKIRLPANVEDEQDRYRLVNTGNEVIGIIVGWSGGECVYAPVLYVGPKIICVQNDGTYCDPKPDLVRAREGSKDAIQYGGEDAYPDLHGIYKMPVVIKEIHINNKADEIVARQQIAIMKQVGQFVDWGIMYQGEQQIWLVAQTYQGVPAKYALLVDKSLNNVKLKSIQDRERRFYASVLRLRLPEYAEDRFRYKQVNGIWIGVIVGWKGVESIDTPVIRTSPEIICSIPLI